MSGAWLNETKVKILYTRSRKPRRSLKRVTTSCTISISALRLHYATLGAPVRDAHGMVQNAVIRASRTSKND